MKFRHIIYASAMLATPSIAANPTVLYNIDRASSNAKAKVSFLGISSKTATFPKISGQLRLKPKAPSNITLNVTLDARALKAGDGITQKRLKGEDFFNVTRHPYVRFSGKKLIVTGNKSGNITGNLTVRGITKPVTLSAISSQSLTAKNPSKVISLTAKTTINRRDFGMTAYSAIVGKKVKITVNARLVKN